MHYFRSLVIFLTLSSQLFAVDYGSNSAMSVESTISINGTNNRLLGFAQFSGGVIFSDSSSTCSYDAIQSVMGDVTLNGGSLFLQKDMVLSNLSTFSTGGTIYGNGYTVKLPTVESVVFPVYNVIEEAGQLQTSLTFGDDYSLSRTIMATDWSFDSQYLVTTRDGSSGHELYIHSYDGSTITYENSISVGSYDMYSIRWHPSLYYFCAGRQQSGSYQEIRLYEYNTSTQAITLREGIENSGHVYAVAWHPSGNYVLVGGSYSSEELRLYDFDEVSYLSYRTGYNFSPSRVIQDSSIAWRGDGQYFVVGTDVESGSESELVVFSFNGSSIAQDSGVNLDVAVQSVDWMKTDSYIAVGLSGSSERIRVFKHDAGASSLVEKTTARVGESSTVNALEWSPDEQFLAVGLATGGGSEVRVYQFDKATEQLTLLESASLSKTVMDLRWAPNQNYIVAGDTGSNDKITVYNFSFSGGTGTSTPGDTTLLDNVRLDINSTLIIPYVLKIAGSCFLEGNGNVIDLSTADIQITAGSSLEISNAIVTGLSGDTIRCLDNTGVLTLKNVSLLLDGTYTFSWGAFEVHQDVGVFGGSSFVYQSTQPLTVKENSQLEIGHNGLFSYEPLDSNREHIALTDETSRLFFNNSSLQVTSTGLKITKGTLVVDGRVTFDSDASVAAEAIEFGDGISSMQDAKLTVLPGATLELASGLFVNNNCIT